MDAPPVLDDAVAFDVDSVAVGDTYRIFVARCHATDASDVPTVYLTDANGAFGMTVDIVRYLQLSRHLPGLLVVGVGYPVAGFRAAQLLRTRDLTPTRCDEMTGGDGVPHPSGGADRFLSFVVDELQPLIAERHPVGPSASYVGHSFGGLFGAYALLERPASFDRYVLASPSIWWDDRAILERARAAGVSDRERTAAVAILVGEEETPEGRLRADVATGSAEPSAPLSTRDLVRDAHEFAATLAGWHRPELSVRFRALADEHHVTVPAMAVSLGLRALFGAPGADRLIPPV